MKQIHRVPKISFDSIRPHHGTQHGGFEELVVSLFRHEFGPPFDVLRVHGSGGDGGVEAFTSLANGYLVGLQAKFFKKAGSSQFRQIEESINSARNNHPSLACYVVAAPVNFNPTQIVRWMAMKAVAKQLEPSLDLVLWGESEIIELLTRREHAGRLVYWFGTNEFNREWLQLHNQRSRCDLDTRYTPANHVRVQLQMQLEAFAHSKEFVGQFFERARWVWITWRSSLESSVFGQESKDLVELAAVACTVGTCELMNLGDGEKLPDWGIVRGAIERLLYANRAIADELGKLSADAQAAEDASNDSEAKQKASNRRSALRGCLGDVRKAKEQLRKLADVVEKYECCECRCLLVKGEAGSGKSHLLARFVEEQELRGRVILFLLGEYFTSSADPWTQLVARIGWSGDEDSLLASINYEAEATGKFAVLVVDALNESHDRRVWLNHLGAFSDRLVKWPWIRLLVSNRNDFDRMTIPARLLEGREPGWSQVEHRGFGLSTFDAVTCYFEGYGVRAREYPPMLPEFGNPLFLKTFAEAFAGGEIPSGPISLDLVMRKRVRVAAEYIERSIDCPPDSVEAALEWLAKKIEENGWQPIPIFVARQGIDSFFISHGQSRSLYHYLKSSGLVTEVGSSHYEAEPEVLVRFAYERFSDYFIAKRILKGFSPNRAGGAKGWRVIGGWNNRSGYYRNRGLMRALAILMPEQHGVELVDVFRNAEIQREVASDFLASLPWKSAGSINRRSIEIFREVQEVLPANEVLEALLRVSSITGHPLNADYLHERFKVWSLVDRDLAWTIPISKSLRSGGSVAEFLVRWIYQIDASRISDQQAFLIGTVLSWFFSSNDRGFRKRATIAAIKLLVGKCRVMAQLVHRFHEVNDPYVVERVLATAAGVAVREQSSGELADLAAVVFKAVFEPKFVKLHLYTRHYGYMVMEKALRAGVLPKGVGPEDYKPRYRSEWPQICPRQEARSERKTDDGWSEIIRSIETEYGNGMSGYGDFGRYVMQAHVRQWTRTKIDEPYPTKKAERPFDEEIARCWVLQRIIEIGWTPERFSKYDGSVFTGRQRVDIEEGKQERIGKKYQWIALREFEALLSDHYHLARRWSDSKEYFEGVWQLYSSGFDPTQPLEDPSTNEEDDALGDERIGGENVAVPSWINYPDPFADKGLTRDRSAWVRRIPDDLAQMLQVSSVDRMESDGLVLGLWQKWDEPDSYPPRELKDGIPHLYLHVRAWIVPLKERQKWLKILRETHFWGDGVDLPSLGASDLGDYPWASRFEDFGKYCENEQRFGRDFPTGLGGAACIYNNVACIPSPKIVEILQAGWSGRDFDFVNGDGEVVSTAPRDQKNYHIAPCVVRKDRMLAALKKRGMGLLWGVVGEKYCFDHEVTHFHVADSHVTFSGVYYLDDKGQIKGGLTMRHVVEFPPRDGPEPSARPQWMEKLGFGTKIPKNFRM